MTCERCRGLCVREWWTKQREKAPRAWWWRCLTCGERVDWMILRHRAEQAHDAAWHAQQDHARQAVDAMFK
ncbi:MAG: hypothetical protein U0172_03405 [Nitrospiraceae bacterium]